ncbi:MAG TPA: radical SAM protein, partial [Devosia sp.]|nr:radical SAM protein [Devosia sp.]
VIKRELPIDILEFFYLTPLPGSEDHQKLFRAGEPMDPDLNKYDLNHATRPVGGKMSKEEWERCYRAAWQRYYTVEHVTTLMKRSAATGLHTANILFLSTWFAGGINIEGVHPLECGALRRKFRHARRPELGLESPLLFYPRYWAETVGKLFRWGLLYGRYGWQYLKIERDPHRFEYTDLALTPVSDEDQAFEMFKSKDAVAYLKQEQRLEAARHGQAIRLDQLSDVAE